MRILLIHRYFWPDAPPYASLLREIGENWAREGHEVCVLSSQPSYKIELKNESRPLRENLGSLHVIRCRLIPEKSRSLLLRALNSFLFVYQILWHLVFRKRYDVVMCSTVPPVVTGWMTSIGSRLRGSKFIYHAMDIWPEVAVISNQMKPSWLYRLLRSIDTGNCRRSAAVVCLSSDMKQTFLRRCPSLANKIHVINNFELPSFNHPTVPSDQPTVHAKPAGTIRILFAGNLGRYQGLESVLETSLLLRDDKQVEFIFLGDGSAKPKLMEIAKSQGTLGRSVFFLPHQSPAVAKQMMHDSDLCLVTLAPKISTVAFPSKSLTILAMGCPLAVMVEPESELSTVVRRMGLGIAVDCGDAQGLATAIRELASDRSALEHLRRNVEIKGPAMSTQAYILPRWSDLLAQLISNGPPVSSANARPDSESIEAQ